MNKIEHKSGLVWWPEQEMGYFPVQPNGVYGKEYWDKYVGYAITPTGQQLTRARVELVKRHCREEPVVDIGIGCGQFIEARGPNTLGYDVNPVAVEWLKKRDLWFDPYTGQPQNIACWDSLEHVYEAAELVDRVGSRVIVSLPIFRDMEHVLRSKHFRPDEHYWYWTRKGFVEWMELRGFVLLEENRMEEKAGREDIGTFAFGR